MTWICNHTVALRKVCVDTKANMKKILIITTIGGFLQQFEMNDVKILQEKNYQIHYASNFENLVYETDLNNLKKQGIILHHICIQKSPLHIWKNCRAFVKLCRIVKEEKIDVIHCHNPMGGVLGRLVAVWCKKARLYVIYTAHGLHFYKGAPLLNWLLYFPVEYLLAKCTDFLITINGEDYTRVQRFAKRKNICLARIPSVGVDVSKFAPEAGIRIHMRQKLGIDKDAFYVLSVGELNHNKNHEVIIRAIALLHDEQIQYGICGKGYRRKYLEQLAEKLGVEKQVKFFGFRNDIPKMLQCADCFAFPSIREGLGMAALEAMAAGIPLITSDCRGTREYMQDSINGYVCFEGTVEKYAEMIRQMKNHGEVRSRMSEACRKTAQKFDIAETEKVMRRVYGQLP